ncbi:MAG: 3'-5' exonuclease [Acidobacteria bacterium]|nr:3'-5' exonuclease [Acidobacteriota bacterium]
MTRLLVFDTETGGLDASRHSLLTLGLVAWEDGRVLEAVELAVKHEPYVVTGGGMKVNRIDLATHHALAAEPAQVIVALETFCTRHFGGGAITLVGHNIAFDRAFLGAFFASQGVALEPRFHHRTVDTHALAFGLQQAGRLPADLRLSSDGLFAHFGIEVPTEKRHTALGDALATAELYGRLVELMR